MRISFLVIILFVFTTGIFAGDGDYAVSKISPTLTKNADAVIRLEEITFEIKSTKETYFRRHLVITILNENADKWSGFVEYYDKMREVMSVEGSLYDATG